MAGAAWEGTLNVQEYVWDFSVDGGTASTIALHDNDGKDKLPIGAIVTDCIAYVETACTSGGSATLDIGTTTDPNGYLAGIAVAALTANSVHRAGSVAGALLWDDQLGRLAA